MTLPKKNDLEKVNKQNTASYQNEVNSLVKKLALPTTCFLRINYTPLTKQTRLREMRGCKAGHVK